MGTSAGYIVSRLSSLDFVIHALRVSGSEDFAWKAEFEEQGVMILEFLRRSLSVGNYIKQ